MTEKTLEKIVIVVGSGIFIFMFFMVYVTWWGW